MPWSPSTVAGEESRRRRAALMAKPLPQRFEGFSCLFNCWKPFVGLAGTRMARIDPLNGLTGELWGKLSDCLLSRAALKRRLRPMWISNCIGITKERKHLARHEQTLGDKLRTGFGALHGGTLRFTFSGQSAWGDAWSHHPKINFRMEAYDASKCLHVLKKPETQGFLDVIGFHSIAITNDFLMPRVPIL